MYTHKITLLLALALPLPAAADAVDDAYRICKAAAATGLTTECTVSGYYSRVDMTIDTTGAEARKICAGVADQMAAKTGSFNGKWKLRILSPYSGEKAIAVCTLR
jgi:hypothetical protein